MKRYGTKLFLIAATLICVTGTATAENYVSWAGGFYITLPDDWEQVDYQTVDAFLISNQADEEVLDYDAVFAPSASKPFFTGDYLIVTLDTVGELSGKQIDSVLNEMGATFGEDVKYFPVADFLSDMKSNAPSYDTEHRLVTVVSDIVREDQVTKKMMLMTRFYERGLASFYFYSPDSLFEQSSDLFHDIVQSFSTSNIEAAAGKSEVRVADVDVHERDSTEDKGVSTWVILGPIFGMFAVVIAIIAGKKKKEREKEQESTSK